MQLIDKRNFTFPCLNTVTSTCSNLFVNKYVQVKIYLSIYFFKDETIILFTDSL